MGSAVFPSRLTAKPVTSGSVAIMLSTYNGAPFLSEQLHSLLGQTHPDWVLYWRDDGSSDGTREIATDFLAGLPEGYRVTLHDTSRVGGTESFLRLLRAACADNHAAFAFADQDDVWLPEKLARGLAALRRAPAGVPALYCARQMLVDARLYPIGVSPRIRRPGFPAALTQNVATGCTVLLNRTAAEMVARSQPPAAAMHDWWSYLLVTAAGGQVLTDDVPVVLYRQHGGNAVGAPAGRVRRGIAALRRGPGSFMRILRQHLAALAEQEELLSRSAASQAALLNEALRGGRLRRVKALGLPGLVRQTPVETAVFRLWFLTG